MIAIKVTNDEVELRNIPNELKALQEQVGGYIEHYEFPEGVHALFDDDGIAKGLILNEKILKVFGAKLFGTVLLVGADGEEFANCPDVEKWYEKLCE